jgi:SCY1-like protein 1
MPEVKRMTTTPTTSASTLHRQALKSPQPQSAPLSRTSSSANAGAESFFPDAEAAEDDGDAWGEMDDGGDDNFFDAASDTQPQSMSSSTTTMGTSKRETPSTSRNVSGGSAKPFDDGAEPDFAGWLAAQAQKKTGAGKQLPKGLAKSAHANGKTAAASAAKKTAAAAKPKPVVAKKIDMKPKETEDDDGWGDGW